MAAMTKAKFTEMPLRTTLSLHSSQFFIRFRSLSLPATLSVSIFRPLSSLSNKNPSKTPKPIPPSSSSWISKWPSLGPRTEPDRVENRRLPRSQAGAGAIERIVLRLRNLGLDSDEEEEEEEEEELGLPVTGDEKLGDLLQRDWVRPDKILLEEGDEDDGVLPWERAELVGEGGVEERKKRRTVKAPTLAELTIEDGELRRLRREGMTVRERVSVAKAGVTGAVLEKMHDQWRKSELVRLKFHESLAHDMKTAHELVERRSGGLVIWRAGSVMMVYRGSNYNGPPRTRKPEDTDADSLFIPEVSKAADLSNNTDEYSPSMLVKGAKYIRDCVRTMTEEEAEYDRLLNELGPRFEDWWGTGILPVDADLLPQTVPGYKTPLRLLPTGMRSRLTNAELTNLRKHARSLPCHFALGRNRNHQGLAKCIIKLWEKSLVAKIAVKRGIQNTNNKLMADEIKMLTGGVLLLRNKYFIVIYRGKDFIPTTVAAALSERQEMTKEIENVEEKARIQTVVAPLAVEHGEVKSGTLAEFYEAQSRWGRDLSAEEREKMIEEADKAKCAREVKRKEHKLQLALSKLNKTEKALSKVEASMLPVDPSDDQETITEEERVMFRRVGLRMKPYLPLGIRGVFDGVIENMHLHWKHRELVKLISKQKNLAFIEETAKLLEYESGGILVAIERVSKGHALIYYRGKNYRRPISLRPRNLLTKAKALKRSVAMQRHEALSQHVEELEKTIEAMKLELGGDEYVDNENGENRSKLDDFANLSHSEDDDSWVDSDGNEDNSDWENDEPESVGLDDLD